MIAQLNLELDTITILEPVFTDSNIEAYGPEELSEFQHLIKLQNLLTKRNFTTPTQSSLHLLASFSSLSELEKKIF